MTREDWQDKSRRNIKQQGGFYTSCDINLDTKFAWKYVEAVDDIRINITDPSNPKAIIKIHFTSGNVKTITYDLTVIREDVKGLIWGTNNIPTKNSQLYFEDAKAMKIPKSDCKSLQKWLGDYNSARR